jgi:hypothetical protein
MKRHHYVLAGLAFCLLITGCGAGLEASFKPVVIPISIGIDSQGTIKATFDKEFRTPIGTFSVDIDTTLAQIGQQTQKILIVQVDQIVTVYSLDEDKEFHIEFAGDNQLYRKVRLEYQQNGNILLELESVAIAPLPQQTQAESTTMNVYADQGWQSTGLFAQPGETVTVAYITGTWSPWPGLRIDGRGCLEHPSVCSPDPNHPANVVSFKHGGLVGMVGNQTFAVGNAIEFSPSTEGIISLRINDHQLNDNSGALSVRVTVTR